MNAFVGEAAFLEAERTRIQVGPAGLKGLLAYLGPVPIPDLLCNLDGPNEGAAGRTAEARP